VIGRRESHKIAISAQTFHAIVSSGKPPLIPLRVDFDYCGLPLPFGCLCKNGGTSDESQQPPQISFAFVNRHRQHGIVNIAGDGGRSAAGSLPGSR
jgi:hypothetical protein